MHDRLTATAARAVHAIGAFVEQELRHLGLTHAEIQVLAHLAAEEAVPLLVLHRSFGHRRSTLTGVLDRLEGRGFVERRPQPGDRRATLVALTSAGREAAGAAAGVLDGLEARVEAAVSGRSVASFHEVCAAIENATKE